AVLVLAKLCDDEGLFEAAGAAIARVRVGSHGLLRQVFLIASIITAVLSLDATVVLLTPVVLATVRRLRTPLRPYAYATAHLANAASLLLPVSNLTNLLAFHLARLSFTKFTLVMALPWLAAVAVVYVIFRWFFAKDLRVTPHPEESAAAPRPPVFVLVVVGLTLAGLAVAQSDGIASGVGGTGRRLRAGGAQPASWTPHRGRDRAFCERVLSGVRSRPGRGGAGGHAQRNRQRDVQGVAARREPARVARHRRGGRCPGQRRQQPAGDAGAAAAGSTQRTGGHPGGTARGQHRTEPDLCRFAVESVVAPRATPAQRRSQCGRIHPVGAVHRAPDTGGGRTCVVGVRATAGCLGAQTHALTRTGCDARTANTRARMGRAATTVNGVSRGKSVSSDSISAARTIVASASVASSIAK